LLWELTELSHIKFLEQCLVLWLMLTIILLFICISKLEAYEIILHHIIHNFKKHFLQHYDLTTQNWVSTSSLKITMLVNSILFHVFIILELGETNYFILE
jgi:hypothetical protein